MTEATFHVAVNESVILAGRKRWFAEALDVDGSRRMDCRIGYGSTPGEAVDDLVQKLIADSITTCDPPPIDGNTLLYAAETEELRGA